MFDFAICSAMFPSERLLSERLLSERLLSERLLSERLLPHVTPLRNDILSIFDLFSTNKPCHRARWRVLPKPGAINSAPPTVPEPGERPLSNMRYPRPALLIQTPSLANDVDSLILYGCDPPTN